MKKLIGILLVCFAIAFIPNVSSAITDVSTENCEIKKDFKDVNLEIDYHVTKDVTKIEKADTNSISKKHFEAGKFKKYDIEKSKLFAEESVKIKSPEKKVIELNYNYTSNSKKFNYANIKTGLKRIRQYSNRKE